MTARLAPLDGTVALVTGASSGIGRATARRLAGLGAHVSVVARRTDRLNDLVKEIREAGGAGTAVAADITDRTQAESAVTQTIGEHGRLDMLVNCAGLMLIGPTLDADVDEWERMIAINQRAVLYTTRAALPHLLRSAADGPRHVADLVNVSSQAGRTARANFGVYNMTKFGINGFSESLRQELASKHLRVGIVEPGAVDTELASHNREEIQNLLATEAPEREPLHPEDIADDIAYMVTRPRRASIPELWSMPTNQG